MWFPLEALRLDQTPPADEALLHALQQQSENSDDFLMRQSTSTVFPSQHNPPPLTRKIVEAVFRFTLWRLYFLLLGRTLGLALGRRIDAGDEAFLAPASTCSDKHFPGPSLPDGGKLVI